MDGDVPVIRQHLFAQVKGGIHSGALSHLHIVGIEPCDDKAVLSVVQVGFNGITDVPVFLLRHFLRNGNFVRELWRAALVIGQEIIFWTDYLQRHQIGIRLLPLRTKFQEVKYHRGKFRVISFFLQFLFHTGHAALYVAFFFISLLSLGLNFAHISGSFGIQRKF